MFLTLFVLDLPYMTNRHLWVTFLFCTIPVLALILHIATLNGDASNASIVYLPFYLSIWMGSFAMVIGTLLTFAAWFFIGHIAGIIALKFNHSTAVAWFLFGIVFCALVILPWWPEFQRHRRVLGIGYTPEDCRKIDPNLNGGTDRSMCIRSSAIRMVNQKDSAVNEDFCNSLAEEDSMMIYCWRSLANAKGTAMDFCRSAALPTAKASCNDVITQKLYDEETLCLELKDDGRIACLKDVHERGRDDVSADHQ